MGKSYSLEGEDRIIYSLLREVINDYDKEKYFYVDIGCNEPVLLSNTNLFYREGFKGICVDPIFELGERYQQYRQRDLFVNVAIGKNEGQMGLTIYSDSAASSGDFETVERYNKKFSICDHRTVKTITLRGLIEDIADVDYCIPFLDIDVEGMDTELMADAVELRMRPMLICVENKLSKLSGSYPHTSIDKIAHCSEYALIAKTPLNSIYIDRYSKAFSWIPSQMM